MIRTNNIKAKIDNTQLSSKYWLSREKDEIVNNTISWYSKLVQKEYKSRYDWVGKVIY